MIGGMQQLLEQMNLAKQVQGSAKRKVSSLLVRVRPLSR